MAYGDYIWNLIREDEETSPERDEEICECSLCGKPICYGDDAVSTVDLTTPIVVCDECANAKMTLAEWLSELQLDYYDGEAGRAERYAIDRSRRNAARFAKGVGA